MNLDIDSVATADQAMRKRRRSRHSVHDRLKPSRRQYDYLALHTLQHSIRNLIKKCSDGGGVMTALDLGASRSPYRELLESKGYCVSTLDIDPENGPDFVGSIEDTELPSESFDLVLCTQVLEHCFNPWKGIAEVGRILKHHGRLIVSVPHVWFYHPHPTDHWRFTQEGILELCRMGGLVPETLLSQGGSILAFTQIVNFLAYGVLGSAGTPLYLVSNFLGKPLDALFPNAIFSLNFACLAVKP